MFFEKVKNENIFLVFETEVLLRVTDLIDNTIAAGHTFFLEADVAFPVTAIVVPLQWLLFSL